MSTSWQEPIWRVVGFVYLAVAALCLLGWFPYGPLFDVSWSQSSVRWTGLGLSFAGIGAGSFLGTVAWRRGGGMAPALLGTAAFGLETLALLDWIDRSTNWILPGAGIWLGLLAGSTAFGLVAGCLFPVPHPPVAGCCPQCGYDLTGNLSGVCPECGAAKGDEPTG
jgi:hypothetical protein